MARAAAVTASCPLFYAQQHERASLSDVAVLYVQSQLLVTFHFVKVTLLCERL